MPLAAWLGEFTPVTKLSPICKQSPYLAPVTTTVMMGLKLLIYASLLPDITWPLSGLGHPPYIRTVRLKNFTQVIRVSPFKLCPNIQDVQCKKLLLTHSSSIPPSPV